MFEEGLWVSRPEPEDNGGTRPHATAATIERNAISTAVWRQRERNTLTRFQVGAVLSSKYSPNRSC